MLIYLSLMYKIDDLVVNNKNLVCKITSVMHNVDFGLGPNDYFMLEPCFPTRGGSEVKYYVPINSEGLCRRALNKNEIDELLKKVNNLDLLWILNPKVRKATFRQIYYKGDPLDALKIIKSYEVKKVELNSCGKDLSYSDNNLLNDIKRKLYNEFSLALGVEPSEVEAYIREKIESFE